MSIGGVPPSPEAGEILGVEKISHLDSLVNIQQYGVEIVREIMTGGYFKSRFLLPDIADMAEQIGLICYPVLPMQNQDGTFTGNSVELKVGTKRKPIKLLEHHKKTIEAIVFSHVIDDVVDDAIAHTVIREKLINLFTTVPIEYVNSEEIVTHLFDNAMNIICYPGNQYTKIYPAEEPKKSKVRTFELDIADINKLINDIPQIDDVEKKKFIARKNWLNAIIVGLVNTGQQYTKTQVLNEPVSPMLDDNDSLLNRVAKKAALGFGHERTLIKLLRNLNPFFKEPEIHELFQKGAFYPDSIDRRLPREIQMSFGSAVMGMFLVYGDYDVNDDEIMAFNCQIGPMVYLNNRSQDQYLGGHDYMSTGLDTEKVQHYVYGYLGRSTLELPQDARPYIIEYGELIQRVNNYLEKYYMEIGIKNISPLSKQMWKMYIMAHLQLSIGKQAHAYHNFPAHLYSPNEVINTRYSATFNNPESLRDKTNSVPWKKIFDIPTRLYFDLLSQTEKDQSSIEMLQAAKLILSYDARELAIIRETDPKILEQQIRNLELSGANQNELNDLQKRLVINQLIR